MPEAQRLTLDKRRVHDTIEQLSLRVAERFPGSSLATVSRHLLDASTETDRTVAWIERPSWLRRVVAGLVIALFAAGVALASWAAIDELAADAELVEIVTLVEAATNELLLLGAAVLFLVTSERRAKRQRVVHAVNDLRSIAHVIDAHQLTKDPASIVGAAPPTEHSPTRDLSPQDLARYLDYCSEMLAMVAKLGFLSVRRFDDPEANRAVNELEALCTGLSRKIWQKLMMLDSRLVS